MWPLKSFTFCICKDVRANYDRTCTMRRRVQMSSGSADMRGATDTKMLCLRFSLLIPILKFDHLKPKRNQRSFGLSHHFTGEDAERSSVPRPNPHRSSQCQHGASISGILLHSGSLPSHTELTAKPGALPAIIAIQRSVILSRQWEGNSQQAAFIWI